MAYTTINKSSSFQNQVLYTGNSSARTISGVGFQPDFTWIKHRDGETAHMLFDVLRGPLYRIQSNSTNTSVSAANTLTSWNSDSFALGTENDVNGNSRLFVSWNWKANGSGSANTAGSINSTVSANTTSGFSIVKWAGTGATGTVGHGLGVAPSVVIVKQLTGTGDWYSYWKPLGNGNAVRLNTRDASGATGIWNNASPTNQGFSVVNNSVVNASGNDYIAYCFSEVPGFSKIGSYRGNNSTNGTFVYTGFKPSFLMVYNYTAGNENWMLVDNKRDGFNVENEQLFPNTNIAEESNDEVDLLSNGFKLRRNNSRMNGVAPYIYMAFGQSLVGTNNIPNNAR